MSKKTSVGHRTLELRQYLLSNNVSIDSTEFLPQQAAIDVLKTTGPTIKHRIETGELKEKTFFLTEPKRKVFLGVEVGGVKQLLLSKLAYKKAIESHIEACIVKHQITSYADTMDFAGMDWRSPPDRKYCNAVLAEISHLSYEETVDDGYPCLKSAIVVSRNERIPTDSFFECAMELGLLDAWSSKDDKIEFWEKQVEHVYNYYGSKHDE
jgi:hypothetical protein